MTPSAKTALAMRPACGNDLTSGSIALAASAALATFFTPCALSTVAATTTMNHAMTFEMIIPAALSTRILRASPALLKGRRRCLSCSTSSTSCDASQKKRYGEIVVPRTAVSMKT